MQQKARMLWPDAAKGFSILLVVLTHLTSKHYSNLESPLPDLIHLFWLGLSDFLTPVRMPLFFALSGFFVAKYLSLPWSAILKKRIISTYYLFLIWYTLHSLFFLLDPPISTNLPTNLTQQIIGFFWGYTSLWYLYALPLYFGLCKLVLRWKTKALFAATVLSALSGTIIFPLLGNGSSILANLVFFMFAAYYPHRVSRLADSREKRLGMQILVFIFFSSIMSLITFIVLSQEVRILSIDILMGVADVALGFLGIVVGIRGFSFLAQKLPSFARFFAYIGKNTLPIYVLHIPLLSLMNLWTLDIPIPLILGLIYPGLALFAVTVLCLLIYRVLLFFRFKWLFQMPDFDFSCSRQKSKNPIVENTLTKLQDS